MIRHDNFEICLGGLPGLQSGFIILGLPSGDIEPVMTFSQQKKGAPGDKRDMGNVRCKCEVIAGIPCNVPQLPNEPLNPKLQT